MNYTVTLYLKEEDYEMFSRIPQGERSEFLRQALKLTGGRMFDDTIVCFHLDPETAAELRKMAQTNNMTLSEFVQKELLHHLKKRFFICRNCGNYIVDKSILLDQKFTTLSCPRCNHTYTISKEGA